jgi:hypothetical protein
LRYLDPDRFLLLYERLSPLLWYFLVLSIQITFLLLYLYKGFHPQNLSSNKPLYLSALTSFGFLLVGFIFISLTHLGLTPDPAYWGEPGVPIPGWGFGLALMGGIFIFAVALPVSSRLLDTFLPLAIYVAAIGLWLSVPVSVLSSSFYMPIDPPAFQPFPYSDAAYYDQMAHSLLIGNPYLEEVPTRPLYIVLLTMLHRLFGEEYRLILVGQTILMAFIPVTLYYLGKKLHSRAAGVTVALFFIFRELTTLLISSQTRVSNSKTLLVDLPTLLLLLLACLFVLRWLERKTPTDALLAGGTFGLLLLLRTQSLLSLPLILLLALLVLGWKSKASYGLAALFIFGLLITILPWLAHNYLQTGQVTFDAPSQYRIIASQYAYTGNLDIYNYDFEGKSLGQVLIDFTLRDPKFVFGFIGNHFLATQVGGLLAFPLVKPYNGFFEPVNLYWMDWNGKLEWYNAALLILYLAVIALGLGAAWRRWRWLGLVPLVFSFGYALATAIGRFSGWRYDLPADWIWYFYFGIGFVEIVRQAALVFGTGNAAAIPPATQSGAEVARPVFSRDAVVLVLLFIVIGASPWLIKNIALPRYPERSVAALQNRIVSLSDAPPVEEIQAFSSRPGAVIQQGRLLYPRSFSRNKGIASTNAWPAYALRDYPRLGFLLLNQRSTSMVFPGRIDSMFFPHAADAIVLGCQREDFIEVRLVAFPESDTVYLSAPLSESCSS